MRRKYPWERWFSCTRTVLVRGIDYDCSQSTMVQTIRNNASARGLRVRPIDRDDHIVVEVLGEVSHTNQAAITGEHESPALVEVD